MILRISWKNLFSTMIKTMESRTTKQDIAPKKILIKWIPLRYINNTICHPPFYFVLTPSMFWMALYQVTLLIHLLISKPFKWIFKHALNLILRAWVKTNFWNTLKVWKLWCIQSGRRSILILRAAIPLSIRILCTMFLSSVIFFRGIFCSRLGRIKLW